MNSKKHPGQNGPVVVIGGGAAGLGAAYELAKLNQPSLLIEKQNNVGGMARTENYKGFLFDMGGHRFFTKLPEVNNIWHQILGSDFLLRPRLSRIYYRSKWFNYPLRPLNVLKNLGFLESIFILASHLKWQLFPYTYEDTFEHWVTNRFGKHLFLAFFKAYTEKVWGIPCSELRSKWAAQRITGLSFKTALAAMFLKSRTSIKTLTDEFYYPRRGPGMMWNAIKEEFERRSGRVRLNASATKVRRVANHIESVAIWESGQEEVVHGAKFISSMPITEFLTILDPPPPPSVLRAAQKLRYRGFLSVCLIAQKEHLFSDNWIYVHDPRVKVARVQNFKNWSPAMLGDPRKTSLGLEYFCNEGDELWNMPDCDLIELGKQELISIGLAHHEDIEDGCVFRLAKSYPVYDANYASCIAVIRRFLDELDNFQSIGRNGLHQYNNMDHSMFTGILAVRNLVGGEKNDLWSVNADQEYRETIK